MKDVEDIETIIIESENIETNNVDDNDDEPKIMIDGKESDFTPAEIRQFQSEESKKKKRKI